jgi:hypothetical protein
MDPNCVRRATVRPICLPATWEITAEQPRRLGTYTMWCRTDDVRMDNDVLLLLSRNGGHKGAERSGRTRAQLEERRARAAELHVGR